MAEVGIYEARAALSQLVERALGGEEIVITRRGKPAVRLVPVDGVLPPREPGALRGLFEVTDEFFEPMPDDLLATFYEGPTEPDEETASQREQPAQADRPASRRVSDDTE